MLLTGTPELKDLRDAELELADIKMAIYWQKLKELDVYTRDNVRTIKGGNAEVIVETLKRYAVPVELMD